MADLQNSAGAPDDDLITLVDKNVARVRTRSVDISFNELFDMYETKELTIAPEFQRLFRWNLVQRSQFIESLILELPLPPIFVIEVDDGVYELVDGLQRISTYLHFRGKLAAFPLSELEAECEVMDASTDDEDDLQEILEDEDLVAEEAARISSEALKLVGCEIVPELNGLTYDALPRALKIKLKRHYIRMEVIRKENDPRLRYHMFKRLNRGGSMLSDQEVRNATIRLLGNRFSDFLRDVSRTPDFVFCTRRLTRKKKLEMYRNELVLRFFALKNDRSSYEHHVEPFLTRYMEEVSDPKREAQGVIFDYDLEKRLFLDVFRFIRLALADDAFATVNPKGKPIGNFSVYHFEAVTLGFTAHIEVLRTKSDETLAALREPLIRAKGATEFQKATKGGGLNYPSPLKERLEFFRRETGAALGISSR